MNDRKIDDLLSEYAQGLGHSRHLVPAVMPRKVQIWKPVLITSLGAAAIAATVFMPKRAEAAPIDRVKGALQNVRSWTATCQTRDQGQPWALQYRSFHLDGKIRGESPVFGGAPRTYITIIDSDIEYSDHSDLPYILKSKFVLDPRVKAGVFSDPLKNSLQMVGGEMRKDFVRTEGITYKGNDAYSLSLKSKKTGKKYYELMVQKSSNLPLAVLINNVNPSTKIPFEYRIEYSYALITDSSLFKPDPKKYVVDEVADKAQYEAEWAKKASAPESPTIYGSSISPDGTIWITFGVKDREKNGWTPLKILSKNYAQSSSFLMNSYGNSKNFRVNGYEVATSNYIAIEPGPTRPTEIQVEFGYKPAFLGAPKDMKRQTIKCMLTNEKRNFPAFFPCFMQEIPFVFLASNQANVRAHALMARGDYLGAGRAFEEEHRIIREARYYNVSNPLKAAIGCYERLGMKQKIRELRELSKSDPKRPKF